MFKDFKKAMQAHFYMLIMEQKPLYLTDVDKDTMWETYLKYFPEDIRQEYNCNCCKQFVRNYGNVVVIINDKVRTIWDFGCEIPFNKVTVAMDLLVSTAPIRDVFFSDIAHLGTNMNHQRKDDGTVITWEHMHFLLPKTMVHKGKSIATLMGAARDNRNVFKRSLDEITMDAIETVKDLIAQNSLYRGAEFLGMVTEFGNLKKQYENVPVKNRENYCWAVAPNYIGSVAKIRNTAVGTLLLDISNGKDLDEAVTAFERIMAPTNYRRPTALITKKMVEQAEQTIEELGYTNSLGRRFATTDDITVNNVLFVNRDKKKATGLLGDLKETVAVHPKTFSKVEEVPVDKFLKDILPKCNAVEVLFENRHINNLVSLITAQDQKAPSLFKWNNPFSWSYKNSVADSLKEKVKAAGGRVDGELRVSLEWYNYDDLDLHVYEPDDTHIYFRNKQSATGGCLDVDMNAGGGTTRTPVENIIWGSSYAMKEGRYKVHVNQYTRRETVDAGFSVEVECQGQLYNFAYSRSLVQGSTCAVVEFDYSKSTGIKLITGLEATTKLQSKTVWGVDTNKFHKASMILNSPNFWDGKQIGNAHLIFVLDQAHNDEQARGFFNEFLKDELVTHKRVFEALGSRMKVEPTDRQVTGLGFSVTQHTDLICKVEGHFNRTLKINF